jgi:hypothetical protein
MNNKKDSSVARARGVVLKDRDLVKVKPELL